MVAYHKEQRFQAGDLAVEESLLVARSVVVAEGAAGGAAGRIADALAAGAELLAVELLVAGGGEAVVVAHGVDVSDAVLVGAVGVLAGLVSNDAGGGRGGERECGGGGGGSRRNDGGGDGSRRNDGGNGPTERWQERLPRGRWSRRRDGGSRW